MRLCSRLYRLLCVAVSALWLVGACGSSHGGSDGGGGGGQAGAGGSAVGADGGAGQGGGGSSGFQCPGVIVLGDCSAVPIGLVCTVDPASPGAAIGCACLPGTGGPTWQCAPPTPCSAAPPRTGDACPSSSVSAIADFGGCKYYPATVCSCEINDGGASWHCNDVSGG